jgi:hypothetical protein
VLVEHFKGITHQWVKEEEASSRRPRFSVEIGGNRHASERARRTADDCGREYEESA